MSETQATFRCAVCDMPKRLHPDPDAMGESSQLWHLYVLPEHAKPKDHKSVVRGRCENGTPHLLGGGEAGECHDCAEAVRNAKDAEIDGLREFKADRDEAK